MTNSDFEHILHQMSKNDMEKWLQIKGHPFDSFADALAEGPLPGSAPPFDDYAKYDGSLLDFYNVFFQQYLQQLKKIDSNVWDFINVSMGVFIKHYGGLSVDFDLVEECKMLIESIKKR